MQRIYDFIKETLSNEIATSGFPLIYKGQLTHEITKLFTAMAEKKIEEQNIDIKVKRKVFHVMVEFLQNITKHSDDFDDEKNPIGNGIFIVGEEKRKYYVMTGNKIKKDKEEPLKERIEKLNSLNKEELDEMFKKQMREGNITSKGGAGLGLIDLVRKTSSKLIYEFIPIDKKEKYFIIAITIPY
ncbi:SiaB family protein kinase [Bacteroidota bacterium]